MLVSLGKRITHLEKAQIKSSQANVMQLRFGEFENRSRRKNLRFRGIPEVKGREMLQQTIQTICLKLATPPSPRSLRLKDYTDLWAPAQIEAIEVPDWLQHIPGLSRQTIKPAETKDLAVPVQRRRGTLGCPPK